MELQESDLTLRIDKESLLEKIKSDEANTGKLIKWSLQNEQPLGWRAAWLLRQVITKGDHRIIDVFPQVLSQFSSFNPSQKREWLKTLVDQKISEDQEGLLYDLCIGEWKNTGNHPALRASAISLVFSFLRKYPELAKELAHVMTSDYLDTLSPGIKKGVVRQWSLFNK